MSSLIDLKSATTRDEVAALLQTSKQGLAAILFSQPIADRYATFELPKKHGGTRTIKAPDKKLKFLQRKLSTLLQDCLEEREFDNSRQRQVAHGFKRRCSILSNARQHRNRRWVFNMDLQDFFPSINFGRVRGFFLKDRRFLLHKDVATVLAQIACDGNALPQGSPCSPVISNLIAHILDIHIVRLASRVKCTYTRYADDLTFSTNQREFPKEIAYQMQTDLGIWLPGQELQEIIAHSDFKINEKKTRMQFRSSRQDVTGLVVNQKINVPSEYRYTVRAMVHRLFRTGSFHIIGSTPSNDASPTMKREGKLNELHGRLGFIDAIDQHNKKVAIRKHEKSDLTAKEAMYRQFLIYRDFYNAENPVILCEGKTDNVYLRLAIRSLAADFQELASVNAYGEAILTVRLYKYTKTSTGRILGLNDGGVRPLATFISTYKKDTDKFTAPGLRNPVIILFDNDSEGRNSVCKSAKEARISKKAVDLKQPFTHVVKNLYIVPVPLLDGKQSSQIEDLFEAETLDTVIAGKTFSKSNSFDNTKFYGKSAFADHVITPNAKTLNFRGFEKLLQAVSMVIKEHASRSK